MYSIFFRASKYFSRQQTARIQVDTVTATATISGSGKAFFNPPPPLGDADHFNSNDFRGRPLILLCCKKKTLKDENKGPGEHQGILERVKVGQSSSTKQ